MKRFKLLLSIFVFLIGLSAYSEAKPEETEDQAKIRGTIEAYVDSFNEHDARKLASNWVEDCDYVDMTGRMVSGRENIESEYENYFMMYPESSMEITLLSMNFAGDDVAIEDGVRLIKDSQDAEPRSIRYTAIHVRDGDDWKVKGVRDAVAFEPTNYRYLRGLEWLVGEWIDEETDGVTMRSSCSWSENRNFLIRNITTFSGDKRVISATQWIGWDPVKKKIRSWLFDSNGGYGEGNWVRDGNSWIIEAKTVLPSEKVVREKNILTFVDANHLTYESIDRTLDGEPLPSLKETVSYRMEDPQPRNAVEPSR